MSNAQWAIIRKISNKPLMDIFNLVFSRTILNNATKYVISRLRTIEAKSQCENAPFNCRDWVIIEVTLTKDFLGLSRAVNREPPPIRQTAQNPKICLSKASFEPQGSVKSRQEKKRQRSAVGSL